MTPLLPTLGGTRAMPVVRRWMACSTPCMAARASARLVVLSDFLYSLPALRKRAT